jgi:hypothetical protein
MLIRHLQPTKRHEHTRHGSWQNNPKIIAFETDEGHFDSTRAVPCPLTAGAATVHHCRTLHYTTVHRSNSYPRRALILTIGKPPQLIAPPRNHYGNKERRAY